MKNSNKTQIGILFCVDSDDPLFQFCKSQPSARNYLIILNKTDSFGTIFSAQSLPIPTDPVSVSLKVHLF
jgi:hypothetical protein